MKKLTYRCIGLLFLLLLAGCNSSKITSSWKAKEVVPQKYNKLMVLGLIRDAERHLQQHMETHLVNDLKELGYNAVSSLEEYGPKAFDKMDEAAALDKLKNSGIDAVITIVLLDKEKERKYVPGNMFYSPYGYYYGYFWGYHTALYNRIYEPGYYVTDTKYFWEANLYDMGTQKLIYSAQTQSFDPANSESMGHENGQLIVKDLMKHNLLKQ